MAHYVVLYACFLLISLTQVCSQECSEVSVGHNPHDRIMPQTKEEEINFTCTITSSCPFTSYVMVNNTNLARKPANGFHADKNIRIEGENSRFTVFVKKPVRGIYYCGAVVKVSNISVKVLGCGTQIHSGCPIFGTKTGIVVSILCVFVGMINKLL